jgi:glutathione S-transferase
VWLLEEIGAPYELRVMNVPRMDGSGAPDPANPHPDKKVPALVADGVLVTESAAIVLYLTDRFPDAKLGFPIGDPLRGPYLSWLAYYAGVVEPVVSIDVAGLGENEVLRRTFRGKEEMGARVATALRANPYLLGDRFSGADLLLASLAHWARPMLPAGDPVDAWLARINARPALARAFAKDAGTS